MADVFLECEHCKGRRFKDEVLEISYKGKNIYDILGNDRKSGPGIFFLRGMVIANVVL